MSTARTELTSTTVQVGEYPDDFEQVDVIVTDVLHFCRHNGIDHAEVEGVDPFGHVVTFHAFEDSALSIQAALTSYDVVHANVEAWQITESI